MEANKKVKTFTNDGLVGNKNYCKHSLRVGRAVDGIRFQFYSNKRDPKNSIDKIVSTVNPATAYEIAEHILKLAQEIESETDEI